MSQSEFNFDIPILHDFDGQTYEPKHDRVRLNRQLTKVFDLVRDGLWRSLHEISEAIEEPEASISARLRDLRKNRFGAYTVERRRRTEGTFEYRLNQGAQQ